MLLRATSLFAVLLVVAHAKKYAEEDPRWQEFEEFLKWKKFKESRDNDYEERNEKAIQGENDEVDVGETFEDTPQGPPSPDKGALMARYIVNQADWTTVATISTRKDIENYPTAHLVSVSDGLLGKGMGVPYMYLTPRDFTAQDLAKDHRATLLMSLAQGEYCKSKQWDPMDPRCARVIMTGKVKALKNGTSEHDMARKVFFDRHPKLVNMPANHHFFFAKLKIMSIVVLDTFGGPKYVTLKDYLNPSAEYVNAEIARMFPSQEERESRPVYTPVDFLNPSVRKV